MVAVFMMLVLEFDAETVPLSVRLIARLNMRTKSSSNLSSFSQITHLNCFFAHKMRHFNTTEEGAGGARPAGAHGT